MDGKWADGVVENKHNITETAVQLCNRSEPSGPSTLISACVNVLTSFDGKLSADSQKALLNALNDLVTACRYFVDEEAVLRECDAQAKELDLRKKELAELQANRSSLQRALPLFQTDIESLQKELKVLRQISALKETRNEIQAGLPTVEAYAAVLREMVVRAPERMQELKDLAAETVKLLERQKTILAVAWKQRDGESRAWEDRLTGAQGSQTQAATNLGTQ